MSRRDSSFRNCATNSRTDASDANSSCLTASSASFTCDRMSAAAFSPRPWSLQARITLAPRLARSRATSLPIPQFAPVTTAVLPFKLTLFLHTPPAQYRRRSQAIIARRATETMPMWAADKAQWSAILCPMRLPSPPTGNTLPSFAHGLICSTAWRAALHQLSSRSEQFRKQLEIHLQEAFQGGWSDFRHFTKTFKSDARLIAPSVKWMVLGEGTGKWYSETMGDSKGPFTHAIFDAISMRFRCDFAHKTCPSLPRTGF